MSDINPDIPDKPIVVPATPTSTQIGTGSRDLMLLIAALPALVAVLGTRDVKQIVDWFASEPGIAFIGLAIVIGTPIYRQWLARRKHANEVKMADEAPDYIAQVQR